MIIILQKNFQTLSFYHNIFMSLGFSDEHIIKSIDSCGIENYFNIDTDIFFVVHPDFYNFSISTHIENRKNITTFITDFDKNKKTIRLLLNKNLKYINKDNAIFELKKTIKNLHSYDSKTLIYNCV